MPTLMQIHLKMTFTCTEFLQHFQVIFLSRDELAKQRKKKCFRFLLFGIHMPLEAAASHGFSFVKSCIVSYSQSQNKQHQQAEILKNSSFNFVFPFKYHARLAFFEIYELIDEEQH